MSRLVGLVLIVVTLFVAHRAAFGTVPVAPVAVRPSASSGPSVPPGHRAEDAPADPATSAPGRGEADCRHLADGYLETAPVFGHAAAAFVHASYWSPDDPVVRNVLLEGSLFARPANTGGRWWAYTDCRGYAEAQLAGHLERSGETLGDPSLFARAN